MCIVVPVRLSEMVKRNKKATNTYESVLFGQVSVGLENGLNVLKDELVVVLDPLKYLQQIPLRL